MTSISRPTSTAVQLRGRPFIGWLAVTPLLAAAVAGVWLQRAPLLREAANLYEIYLLPSQILNTPSRLQRALTASDQTNHTSRSLD